MDLELAGKTAIVTGGSRGIGKAIAREVKNLLGRWIGARDIAYVVTFLASPKASAINGDVIAAAGGIKGVIYY